MRSRIIPFLSVFACVLVPGTCAGAAAAQDKPLPDPRQLMQDVLAHQKQVDKIRESYTYWS